MGLPIERRLSECHLWRVLSVLLTGTLMAIAGVATRDVLMVDGFTLLDLVALILFEALFGWIAFSAVISLIGLAASSSSDCDLEHLSDGAPLIRPKSRSAILMPIHNEDPEPVFHRLQTMGDSLRALGMDGAFDIFVLSDTRDHAIRVREWRAFQKLKASLGERAFYRRRPLNDGRKAGNIAEWVNRFGDAYAYMVVLDADSLMEGRTLVRLVGAMDAHPRLGLLQTMPRLINRVSVFGRLQQFANRLYGPTMTNGLALFWGAEGNYWGHNAIIRVKAFAGCAGLPSLKGPRPFGGEIRSHDFVEAALLRRGGWEVRMAPHLSGSYEECPPSLPALMARDRRWCQGNLQHLGVVPAAGLHGMSRFHLIYGAMSYLMSPLWLMFLVVTALLSLEGRAPFDAEWNDYNISILRWVLSIAFVCLFIPKIAALARTLANGRERRDWVSVRHLLLGVGLETVLTTLIAPIVMIGQVKALVDILRGRDAGWTAQSRADGSIGWREAFRQNAVAMGAGVALGVLFYVLSPMTLVWAAPTVAGLLLSAPLTVLTACPHVGARVSGWNLLSTPEENVALADAQPGKRLGLAWAWSRAKTRGASPGKSSEISPGPKAAPASA
jgi:membrane glycosyltransferase